MSLAEPQRTQRKTVIVGLRPKKNKRYGYQALHLISLSEIKPNLRVSAYSSEAGEIKECLSQSCRAHRERKIWLASPKNKMDLNSLSSLIIKAAINVHTELGPGLLESVYQQCMAIESDLLGLRCETEVQLPVIYRDKVISNDGFRLDILVENTLIVELKSVEAVKAVHKKQLLTYLRLSGKPLGLLINFNEPLLKDGITRVVNQKATRSSMEAQRSKRKGKF